MRLIARIATLASCLLLMCSGVAFAQSPTQDAYNGELGQQVLGDNDSGGNGPSAQPEAQGATKPVATKLAPKAEAAAAAPSDSGNTLPFTGLELGFVALAGVALLGTGLVLRRSARSPGLGA